MCWQLGLLGLLKLGLAVDMRGSHLRDRLLLNDRNGWWWDVAELLLLRNVRLDVHWLS